MLTYVLAIVVIAFAFDFINGFHDSANSIATVVGTRVLKPLPAVLWAATFNFAADPWENIGPIPKASKPGSILLSGQYRIFVCGMPKARHKCNRSVFRTTI